MIRDEVTVLVVDDCPDDVSIIRRLLNQLPRIHVSVLSANSTGACLQFLETETPQLMFLDFDMPAEDGLSFLTRASSLVDLPPVVMITGSDDNRIVSKAILAGAVECLSKHALTARDLGEVVQRALADSQQRAELAGQDQTIVAALLSASADKPTTGSQRLADLAESLGRGLNLSAFQIGLLRTGALLHDIGKLGVRYDLINRAGPLLDWEFAEIRLHPLIGERLTSPLLLSPDIRTMIRYHHERWDGQGYVEGLAKEEIPLLARVISVVDAFDAMTTDRPYRQALSRKEAISRLNEGSGTQWDPRIVDVFLSQLSRQIRISST